MENAHDTSSEDPEKMAELSRKTTFGEGEAMQTMFIHADPNDGDEALKAFAGHEGDITVMTPEREKQLLRKIDLNLMPVGELVVGC
jgi:ACS family allantoate permease-like MFS transporter